MAGGSAPAYAPALIMKNIHRRIILPVMALTALLCASVPGSAQSVLLTAADYTVLGGTAISVGGPGPNSVINGNVGLSPAATSNITGFPPGVVSGNTISGPAAAIIATGGATQQARLDLITAKNALAAMPSNVTLSNVDLGTVAPLNAGVYTFGGAATQTGALVLDAQGQNGVAWVFNIATSLTTSVNSTVTFINLGSNGGNDLGLFWNVGTAVNIGDNNTILGNYLAGTSISFTGITATLGNGGARALSLAGVSFAGPGVINALGGPGGGDWDGGLMYNGLGQLVAIPPPVVPPVGPPVPPPPPAIVFTGNVILSSTGAFAPGSSGVTLVPGTDYPTTTLTLDGNSSNATTPASLTINTATVTLTGTGNTYTGGTIVNNGALITGSANLPVNQAVSLNASTLNFNQPADGTFGGVISGTGSVIKLGSGALTVSGVNTYTGGTVVNAGALVGSTASLPANRPVVIAGPGVLAFNQTTDGTFGGDITGAGTIQKRGGGTLTMTKATPTAVEVQAGTFIFNTGIGRTTVVAGAVLGGNGTITGNLVNHGTVSPGLSPGTMTVIGNYTQSSTGTLLIEIASATSFDRLVVSGTASLAGTLRVNTLGGYNPVGQSFTFLTAGGGVSGTFASLAGNLTGSAATGVAVNYAPTSATLVFTQLPFAGFAQTPNQAAVGAAAQNVPALTAALNTLPVAAQFPAALNALSPQDYQVWSDFAFAHSTSLADRLLRDHRTTTGRDEYYFEGGQRRGRSRANADLGSSRYTNTSGLVGGNRPTGTNKTAGAYVAYGKTSSGLGSAGGQTTVKEKTIGVRGGWIDGPMFAEAMLSYGFNSYSATRPIQFPGTAVVASSSTRGNQWTAGFTVGRHLTHGSLSVSPFAGLLASRWKANGFTETGAGGFNATVGSQSARSLRSQLGLEGRLNWTAGSRKLQPHARVAWLHEFSDDSRALRASFGSANYSVMTRRATRDTALYSAGLDLLLSPSTLLYTSVSAQGGGTTKVLSEWRAGVSLSF